MLKCYGEDPEKINDQVMFLCINKTQPQDRTNIQRLGNIKHVHSMMHTES